MNLHIEIMEGAMRNWAWVWRVRATSDKLGSEFLAVGNADTEEQARNKAEKVQQACEGLWT